MISILNDNTHNEYKYNLTQSLKESNIILIVVKTTATGFSRGGTIFTILNVLETVLKELEIILKGLETNLNVLETILKELETILKGLEAKISKYKMPNDQMPNYTVQTQYHTIRSTSQKSEKIITTDRTALFLSKPVKCQQQRENKEETIRDKGRGEKRSENRRVETRRKKKRRKEKRREENRRDEQKREEKRKKKKQIA